MQTTALTQERIDFYHENGYIGVENVLSTDEIAALRRVTDEFVERSRSVTEHTNIFDLEPSHTPENPRLRRIKLPITHHQTYRDTLHHAGICNIVSQLIGPAFRQNGNKLNMKQIANELTKRLLRLFEKDETGKYAYHHEGKNDLFANLS